MKEMEMSGENFYIIILVGGGVVSWVILQVNRRRDSLTIVAISQILLVQVIIYCSNRNSLYIFCPGWWLSCHHHRGIHETLAALGPHR